MSIYSYYFSVLKESGHVEKFADLMVKDMVNGECFRCDHLIKAHLERIQANKDATNEVKTRCDDVIVKLDGMTKGEMAAVMREFDMKSPITNNNLTEPMEFNLMFQTHIGPTGMLYFKRKTLVLSLKISADILKVSRIIFFR